MTLYGFYSPTAAARLGTAVWQHKDGHEVDITYISGDPTAPNYIFADRVCVGEVVQHLRGELKSRSRMIQEERE